MRAFAQLIDEERPGLEPAGRKDFQVVCPDGDE
jgi:hypothetical protein